VAKDSRLYDLPAVHAAPGPQPEVAAGIVQIQKVIHDHQAVTSFASHRLFSLLPPKVIKSKVRKSGM
jgi:hypothetical protein